MPTKVTHLRPRKPVRRPGALPARPCSVPDAVSIVSALGFTADDLDVWGPPFPLTPEATSALSRAMEAYGVAAVWEASQP